MSVFQLQGDQNPAKRRVDYQAELNQEQLDAVLNGDGPCLVLAGAGSGKTRMITYRVSYLIESGVDPSQILLLTFTNKAAKEMMSRVSHLLGKAAEGVWGGTFHSIGNRIMRTAAGALGYTSRFSILDQDDAHSLVKAVMKEMSIDPKARRFPTANVVHNMISYSMNTARTIGQTVEYKHPNFVQFSPEIEEIARRYTERKRLANAMDFDDLLRNWLILMANPEYGERIAQQFRYVLVDEYQDTNAIQSAIVRAVAQIHQNVLVVGDDAQSIYAFRGADFQNILNFPTQWPGAKMFHLLTNYRSVPEILDLANESLSHNEKQFQKELIAVRKKGDKPVLVSAASSKQEAQFVAEQILALRAEGVALGNMAVLFRSSAHSQQLEFELLKRDVPYEYRGGMKFFERAHIKDLLAYIRIIDNVRDEAAWLRALNLHQGIGAVTAIGIAKRAQAATDLEAIITGDFGMSLANRARGGWEEFAGVLARAQREQPHPGAMLSGILSLWYRDYLEREYPDWKERAEDLEQLAVFADGYRDVSSFLADIALYDEVISGRGSSESKKQEERIILSTIHQAKGLEWDTVFIIHLADGSFPSKRAMSEAGGMEEERRLFYVAVTRARRKLFLSYPIIGGFDLMTLNQPSQFIEEVSPRLFERMELREARPAVRSLGAGSRFTDQSDRDEWSWDGGSDGGSDEPTIEVDRYGNRTSTPPPTSVWKSSNKSKQLPPTSFLRDV